MKLSNIEYTIQLRKPVKNYSNVYRYNPQLVARVHNQIIINNNKQLIRVHSQIVHIYTQIKQLSIDSTRLLNNYKQLVHTYIRIRQVLTIKSNDFKQTLTFYY